MANTQLLDEMIRDYLIYRGFGTTLKVFDNDLKQDKNRSFRPDKIIEQILQLISNYDLTGLKEYWNHFEVHMFSKLEAHFASSVRKLENAILKLYLVNAVSNSKSEKVMEFFLKLSPELQGQNEWKDWFVLPYTKNAEENPSFSLYFTKQWQDALLLSLNNFFSTIIMYMPKPALLEYEEESSKIKKLQERNESLRSRLALLINKTPDTSLTPPQIETPPPLLDDFYIIAQESTNTESQSKGLRHLIRSMGGGSSPILGRKENQGAKKRVNSATRSVKSNSQFYDS